MFSATRQIKFVEYGSGLFFGRPYQTPSVSAVANKRCAGEEWIDTVTIGDLVIPNQGVGVAELAFGFDGVDGILGYVCPSLYLTL